MKYNQKVAYICTYRFEDKNLRFIKDTERLDSHHAGIGDFKDGFWVNEDYEFTTASDNAYWIPPTAILSIRKKIRNIL